jgi:hypothetical protein
LAGSFRAVVPSFVVDEPLLVVVVPLVVDPR